MEVKLRKNAIFDWALYSWGRDSFTILITSFVFAAYFTKSIATSSIMGTAQWGWAQAIAAIILAIIGPFLGAIADITGKRLWPLGFLTFINIVCTALLFFAEPTHHNVAWALFFYTVAAFAFEATYIYYNAMLKTLAPTRLTGRVSGWGWSAGYFGGIVVLLIALFGFVDSHIFTHEDAINIRAVALLAAAWFLIFAWPMFVTNKDEKKERQKASTTIKQACHNIKDMLKHAADYKAIFKLVIARLFYIDGLNSVFAFAGIYGAVIYHFSFTKILIFAISANVVAGIGTVILAFVDDWLGPKFVVFWGLVFILAANAVIFFTPHIPILFWIGGLVISFFAGALQSCSRTYLTLLSPKDRINQMFGLYAFCGRSTAFIGPLFISLLVVMLHSVHWLLVVTFVLFLIGLLIFITIPSTHKHKEIIHSDEN